MPLKQPNEHPLHELMHSHNFHMWNSGGDCMVWQFDFGVDEAYALLTAGDDGPALGEKADEPFTLGFYYVDGTEGWYCAYFQNLHAALAAFDAVATWMRGGMKAAQIMALLPSVGGSNINSEGV